MGEAEIDHQKHTLTIRSHLVTYGSEANDELTERIRREIETMWNEPAASIYWDRHHYRLRFEITAQTWPEIPELEVLKNLDPRNNYFRIESFVHGNISFVDGLGCNTGYFLLENLYEGSTTAAHEYGHTLGLDHPKHLDVRGQGAPGIMYPRGTLVDPRYQYDPTRPAGSQGGTMHPMHRKVKTADIELLRLHRLRFRNNRAVVGEFTNIYHWNHEEGRAPRMQRPPVRG